MSRTFAELRALLEGVEDGGTVRLEKEVYDVYQEDCFYLTGYHCSNTATVKENPFGERFAAVHIKGKKNILIDGNGGTIVCHGVMTPIVISHCTNIKIKNLTVDYARPTMSEFLVKSFDGEKYLLEINPESLFDVTEKEILWHGERNRAGEYYWQHGYKGSTLLSMAFDPKEKMLTMMKGSKGDSRPSPATFASVKKTGEHTVEVTLQNPEDSLPVGKIVQTRSIIRDQLGGLFERCKNVVMEDCTIYAMHGFGFMCQFVENVRYTRVNCFPKEGRTSASNADIFQFMNCRGRVIVEKCRLEGAHDDLINAHGTYLKVVEANEGERSIVVRFVHPQTRGFQAFQKGDKIAFVDGDCVSNAYATAKVKGYEKLSDTDIKLYLNATLPPSLRVGIDAVDNRSWDPIVVVRDNYMGYNAGRGMLCPVKKAVVENNLFFHNPLGVLLRGCDLSEWFESTSLGDTIFRKNKVVGCGNGFFGDGKGWTFSVDLGKAAKKNSVTVGGKVVVVDNEFTECKQTEYPCRFALLKKLRFENNAFDATYQLYTHGVEKISVKNNEVYVQ